MRGQTEAKKSTNISEINCQRPQRHANFSVVFARWHHHIRSVEIFPIHQILSCIRMLIRITIKIQSPLSWAKSNVR